MPHSPGFKNKKLTTKTTAIWHGKQNLYWKVQFEKKIIGGKSGHKPFSRIKLPIFRDLWSIRDSNWGWWWDCHQSFKTGLEMETNFTNAWNRMNVVVKRCWLKVHHFETFQAIRRWWAQQDFRKTVLLCLCLFVHLFFFLCETAQYEQFLHSRFYCFYVHF